MRAVKVPAEQHLAAMADGSESALQSLPGGLWLEERAVQDGRRRATWQAEKRKNYV